MARQPMGKLCQAVLPAGFERVRQQAPVIQRFLEENLPEPVNRCVTLLTLDAEQIVIAANSPAVAGYLRVHSREIEQQLRETFQLERKIRFCTVPDDLLRVETAQIRRVPRPPGEESAAAIRRSAEWIEDERLRAALLALADSLEPD